MSVYVCPNPRCRQRSIVPGICRACAKKKNYVQVRPESEAALARLCDVSADDVPRLPVPCWPGVEDAIFGGFVLGTVMACYGAPGIGKSTLALHLADALTALGPVAYLTTEQLVPQVKLTALRVQVADSTMLVGYHTTVEEIEGTLEDAPLRFVVVDSLQGACPKGEEEPTAKRLVHAARRHGCAMLLVLHATKDGDYSGPRAVEHEVDGMLCLDGWPGDEASTLGLTVVDKYRYGPVGRMARIGRSESGRLWDWTYGPH